MSILETVRLDEALRAAGIPIHGVQNNGGVFTVDYTDAATAQQRTDGAAIVAAFDASPEATAAWQLAKRKAQAADAFTVDDVPGRLHRAVLSVMLSEINALRTQAGLQPRTANQLKTAILNAITAE